MRGELATVTTRDFVRLHGFYAERLPHSQPLSIGVVFLHGLGGNFYGSPLLTAIAQQLREAGCDILLANTRGHDLLNWTTCAGRSRVLGAATENVAEAAHDLAAWVSYLERQGCARIALIGHSLGAIKALYAQAHDPQPAVFTLIALSPTRLHHASFAAGPKGREFVAAFSRAEQSVAEGRGDELIAIEFPFATWMSAASFVQKYGPEDTYDWFRFADRFSVQALLTFGERELDDHPAFFRMREALEAAQVQSRWPHLTIETIANADHFYVACYRQVADRCAAWIARQI